MLFFSEAILDGRGNLAHRSIIGRGYCPVPPEDRRHSLRASMLRHMEALGLPVEKHHHEVGACQHELGLRYGTLRQAADWCSTYKYVVKNLAHASGVTATFLPKPMSMTPGSGMHVHLSLWMNGRNTFFDENGEYAQLSEQALYAIGGILTHAPALLAITSPTTNSYKRLVPGFEAPCCLAFSQVSLLLIQRPWKHPLLKKHSVVCLLRAFCGCRLKTEVPNSHHCAALQGNRSAAIRIPVSSRDAQKSKRIEFRCPDPSSCPYLTFSAVAMAAADGIKRKMTPPKPLDCNLYSLSEAARGKLQMTPPSLSAALDALEEDHEFLLHGDVFSEVSRRSLSPKLLLHRAGTVDAALGSKCSAGFHGRRYGKRQ